MNKHKAEYNWFYIWNIISVLVSTAAMALICLVLEAGPIGTIAFTLGVFVVGGIIVLVDGRHV